VKPSVGKTPGEDQEEDEKRIQEGRQNFNHYS
jgi:hypothetical protein